MEAPPVAVRETKGMISEERGRGGPRPQRTVADQGYAQLLRDILRVDWPVREAVAYVLQAE